MRNIFLTSYYLSVCLSLSPSLSLPFYLPRSISVSAVYIYIYRERERDVCVCVREREGGGIYNWHYANEETMDRQCRGMDGETISREPGTGTRRQQTEETGAQFVKMAPRRLHRHRRPKKKKMLMIFNTALMKMHAGNSF